MLKDNTDERISHLEKQQNILQHQLHVRNLFLIIVFGIFLISFFSYGLSTNSTDKIETGPYITQNLRGDTIDTWLYWNVADANDPFHIHIVNDAKIDENKMKIIYDAILSTDSIQIDDLLLHKGPSGQFTNFYKGWAGAMNASSQEETKIPIPTNFHVHESSSNNGEIIITLSPYKSTEGYSGYTRSLTNENQILQSYITIYQADTLSESQIGTILRHELGHAFGLKHATDPDDLMHETITTGVPYISDCAVEALRTVYNLNTNQVYPCQK